MHILEPLLIHHLNWPKLKNLLEEGSNWKLDAMSEKDRVAKNSEFITRGNHKSAKKYDSELCKTIEKELKQGWMFPLPLNYISSLKHGELAPVGMDDKQWQELPNRKRAIKHRMTHDQLFGSINGLPINKRIHKDALVPLYFGGCLSCLIHYTISVRFATQQ
jgi:hypothetical protein